MYWNVTITGGEPLVHRLTLTWDVLKFWHICYR